MTAATRPLFNQPTPHERQVVESGSYLTVREWLGSGWQPVLWIYQDCGDWIISEGRPNWLNDWGTPSGRLWWAEEGRESAIELAIAGTHQRWLDHHSSCPCPTCQMDPFDYGDDDE